VNRERLLFAGVLALVALWYLVFREPARIAPPVQPKTQKVDVAEVRPVAKAQVRLELPQPYGAFTQITNEKEHPRPVLEAVAPRDLPGIWPPTSRTVRLSLLGRLRHETVPPVDGEATLTLPAMAGGEGAPANGEEGEAPVEAPARIDDWSALGNEQSGRVLRIRYKGEWIKDPGELPPVGPPAEKDFHRLLAWSSINQGAASDDGVSDIEVRLRQGTIPYPFPKEINNLRPAVGGKEKPYWDGLVGYLRLPKVGVPARLKFAADMIAAGRQGGPSDPRLEWALVALKEALDATPQGAGGQAQRKAIVLQMLAAANALYQHERVLQLAFDHLAQYPDDEDVIYIVGSLLASRTFGLLDQAEQWLAKAPRSAAAQRKRVDVLLRLDRFEDARDIVATGAAGSGPEVDLLASRAALALGDFDRAVSLASPFVIGEHGVEANLLLGGVAYARGDAAKAAEHFLAAAEKDPGNSRAFSDLGLAMAVQGKAKDALACFDRAEKLDFENTVIPGIGRLYLQFAIADAAHATEEGLRRQMETRKNKAEFEKPLEQAQQAQADALAAASALVTGENGLEGNNPLNLLVRYFAGYTLERQGDPRAAFEKYRSVIDSDHRYRIAIARLGVVLARHLEGNPDDPKAEELAKAADAHLTKSQALNPNDPLVPYVLARFHMVRGTRTAKADRMFAITAELPAPAGDPDLPGWAAAGRAALAYRNDDIDASAVKSLFANVQRGIKQRVSLEGAPDLDKALAANEVYTYCQRCIDAISENQSKRVVSYTFRSVPKDWNVKKRHTMVVLSNGRALEFRGSIDNKGGEPDPYENNSIQYENREISRASFYGVVVKGEIPSGTGVSFGVSVVVKRRGRGTDQYAGIELKRTETGLLEVAVDGASRHEPLKNRRGDWLTTGLRWEPGAFEVRIEVVDRDQGTFQIWLKQGENAAVNVFEEAWKVPAETTRLLTRGGTGGPFQFYIWVDGNEGTKYAGILVNSVSLVKGVK